MVDELHRQIIELQGKLLEKSVGQKKNNALPAKYSFKDICYTSTCMQKQWSSAGGWQREIRLS